MKTTHNYAVLATPVTVESPDTFGNIPTELQQRFYELSVKFHIAHHVQSAVKRAVEKEKADPWTDEYAHALEVVEAAYMATHDGKLNAFSDVLNWCEIEGERLRKENPDKVPELLTATRIMRGLPEHHRLLKDIADGTPLTLLDFMPSERKGMDGPALLKKLGEIATKEGKDKAAEWLKSLSEDEIAKLKQAKADADSIMQL